MKYHVTEGEREDLKSFLSDMGIEVELQEGFVEEVFVSFNFIFASGPKCCRSKS